MGDVVRGNSRRIYLNVTGESCIDYVDIVKNGQILARMNGPLTPIAPEGDTVRCKVKVDFGWNRERNTYIGRVNCPWTKDRSIV